MLQFGGASRSRDVSMEQYDKAMQELSETGGFEKGVYTWYREDGKRVNKDAFEAIWERVNGRSLEYPQPRYSRPVLMQPDHFNWIAMPDVPGVERKLLGVFSELRTRAVFYRLQSGAELPLEDNSLYFITDGTGKAGDKEYAGHTTIHVLQSETQIVSADIETELLQLGLPFFA